MNVNNYVNEALASVIRAERGRRNLSQEELALNCDMHRKYLSDLENSKHSLSLNNLIRIINGLNMNFIDFMIELEKELKNRKAL